MTGRVQGRVVVKESGAGISGLGVELLDAAGHRDDTRRTLGREASRLGSAITDDTGAFDIEFPWGGAHALVLVVLAPEEPGAQRRVLYTSPEPRSNAAVRESFLVRLSAAVVRELQLMVPSAVAPDAAAAADWSERARAADGDARGRDTAARSLFAARVHDVASAHPEAAARFDRFHEDLSRFSPEARSLPTYVGPGSSVRAAASAAVRRGLDQVIHPATRVARARLSHAQSLALGLRADNGALSAADLDASLLSSIIDPAGEQRSVALERRSVLQHLCGLPTLPEGPCAPAAPVVSPAPAPAVATEPPAFDLMREVARLLSPSSGPESAVQPPRPTREAVSGSVDALALRPGPADAPAYYDFHRLHVAFEHIWQEAFDAGVIDAAKEAYRRFVDLGVSPVLPPPGAGLTAVLTELQMTTSQVARAVADPPDAVLSAFPVTPAQWRMLTPTQRVELHNVAQSYLGKAREVPPDTDGMAQFRAWGERILRWADARADSGYLGVDALLDDLQARLAEPHAFKGYAARGNERSINFGVALNYRQEWRPLSYQAGRLVKTIPLAPKEVRKYVQKTSTKRSRAQKEVESSLQSRKSESQDTSRADSEIVQEAQSKTNFKLSARGGLRLKVLDFGADTSTEQDSGQSSKEAKRAFREAVLKSAEEYKSERSVEITTSESVDTEAEMTGEISNPNDELAVTYLFYELQRRYRVREFLHRATPVVLVAQELPAPHQITEGWLVAHDWILRRVLLDDSFAPALGYLATRLPGDERSLEMQRRAIAAQGAMVAELRTQFMLAQKEAGRRYLTLERSLERQATEAAQDDPNFIHWDPTKQAYAVSTTDEDARARLKAEAARDADVRAAREEKELRDNLEREVIALHSAQAAYARALAEHLNQRAQVSRLRVHVKQNILYYMQAIWAHEPTDQRVLRLRDVEVPRLEGLRAYRASPAVSMWNHLPHIELDDFDLSLRVTIDPVPTTQLGDVARLDDLLGFQGNYMLFPMTRPNALTDFMLAPYQDTARGLRDPDGEDDLSLEEFAQYVCCLKQQLTLEGFTAVRAELQSRYNDLVARDRRGDDEVILPTGSLFIEALPGAHPILEEYKLGQRVLDTRRFAAQVRFAELENLRVAARLKVDQYGDPKIDKTIVVEAPVLPVVPVDE